MTNGNGDYYRRRADEMIDVRMAALERKIDDVDAKVDALTVRITVLGTVAGAVILLANIIGPVIADGIINGRLTP